jgi:hypothetical protein
VGLVGREFVGVGEGGDGRFDSVVAGGHGDREGLGLAAAQGDERVAGDHLAGGEPELAAVDEVDHADRAGLVLPELAARKGASPERSSMIRNPNAPH